MENPLINYDGEEREMTDEEWSTHQAYQAETRSNHEAPTADADNVPDPE